MGAGQCGELAHAGIIRHVLSLIILSAGIDHTCGTGRLDVMGRHRQIGTSQ